MRYAVDPRQKVLFDPAETMFSELAIKHMQQDWPGLFRHQILHLMPVGKLAERFHPTLGCPSKELYSMAGAIFLKESHKKCRCLVRRCISRRAVRIPFMQKVPLPREAMHFQAGRSDPIHTIMQKVPLPREAMHFQAGRSEPIHTIIQKVPLPREAMHFQAGSAAR